MALDGHSRQFTVNIFKQRRILIWYFKSTPSFELHIRKIMFEVEGLGWDGEWCLTQFKFPYHNKKLWGSIWGGVGCRIDRSARLGVLVGCGRAILKKFSHNATPSIYIKVEGNDEDWIWFLREGCTSQSLATEPRKLYRIFCCLCIHWWDWLTGPFCVFLISELGNTSHKKNRFLSGIARKGGGEDLARIFLPFFHHVVPHILTSISCYVILFGHF